MFLLSFLTSAFFTLLLVRSSKFHGHRSADSDFSKPQKFHTVPVPRIGGLGVAVGILAGGVLVYTTIGRSSGAMGMLLLACALPAFLAGFVQDFTEAITPRGRLLATSVSAVLAYYVLDAAIVDTAIPGLDWIVGFGIGSLLLTVFAVSGIANAINIIDGFNGLAAMCTMIMLGALCYVAFQCGDPLIATLALAGLGAILGFFIWNFPAGLIFLGDGGAYFLGFYVAELSILLLRRNPGEVSPIFPLLVCVYPIFETLFSIYRRSFLRGLPPSVPDGIHLHSLIYRRIMRWAIGNADRKALTRRNSMTSPYLWLLCMLSVIPSMLFWNNTPILTIFLIVFGVSYVLLYWRIVRFKSPRFLKFSPSRARSDARADNSRT